MVMRCIDCVYNQNITEKKEAVARGIQTVASNCVCYVCPARETEVPIQVTWWMFWSCGWSHDLASDPDQCQVFWGCERQFSSQPLTLWKANNVNRPFSLILWKANSVKWPLILWKANNVNRPLILWRKGKQYKQTCNPKRGTCFDAILQSTESLPQVCKQVTLHFFGGCLQHKCPRGYMVLHYSTCWVCGRHFFRSQRWWSKLHRLFACPGMSATRGQWLLCTSLWITQYDRLYFEDCPVALLN